MLIPEFKSQFKKDLHKQIRRNKDITKLISVICMLVCEMPLPRQYENHPLKGSYAGCMECHIEPDWLLVYQTDDANMIFVRTGTHSHLF